MEKPRLPGYTLIERPWGREVHTTPADTPEQLAQLFAYLERTGTPVPPALREIIHKNVAPVSLVLVHPAVDPPGTATASSSLVAAPTPTSPHPSSPTAGPAPAEVLRVAVPASNDPSATGSFTAHRGKAAEWLGDVIEQWRQHKVNTGSWKAPSTWTNAYGPDLRVFRELVADAQRIPALGAPPIWDIRLGDLDEAHLARFVEANWRYPDQQGRPRNEDAKRVLVKSDPAQAQGVYAAKKKLVRVKVFLSWAVSMKYLPGDVLLPLEVALANGPKTDPNGGYRRFTTAELQKIFGAKQYAEDGFDHAWQYWAPLLARCTSGRIREIADLTLDDFIEIDGVPCVFYRGGDVVEAGPDGKTVVRKRVKTPASTRKVPLSKALLDLGLLDYIARRREQGYVWAWDDLLWEEKSGRGRYVTRWFAQFLDELGIGGKRKKVFHSFRSNLHHELMKARLDSVATDLVLGHSPTSIRGKNYTHDPSDSDTKFDMPIPLVRDVLNAIDWGVKFHHSRKWGGHPPA